MFLRKLLQRITSSKVNLGAYLLEIFLIIFSILIAIQADRYQQSQRNKAKLKDYIAAMHQDLLNEQNLNRNNLIDCLQDIKNIETSLRLSQMDQNDSLDLALLNFGQVINRGVFRAFPPTTYDIMLSTGDIALIRNLELRSTLASPFSFRESYTKRDLLDFDQHADEVAEKLAQYGSLSCMVSTPTPHSCLQDRTGFLKDFHNQLFILLTKARSRAFHLRIAINYFDGTIEELEKAYDIEVENTAQTEEAETQED